MVTIMSCSDCNVACKHCYISYSGNFEPAKLIELTKNLKKKHAVRINGAEPLIHPEFLPAYALAGQFGPLTNGLVFNDNFSYLDELKKHNMSELYISYHFDLHDKISCINKSYLEKLFQEILNRGLSFVIMCTITTETYKNVETYCDTAFKLGAKAIKFTNYLNQGKAKKLDHNLILNDEQIAEFFQLVDQCRNKFDKSVFEIKRCGSFGPNRERCNKFECLAGINHVCVTPDMKVYPCVFLAKPGFEIGYCDGKQIFIDSKFENDTKECIAKKILNENADPKKILNN